MAGEKNSIVLFDFDKTIINKDTGYEFILYSAKKNMLRAILLITLSPIAFFFFMSNKSRFIGNSIFLWLATFGMSQPATKRMQNLFIDSYLKSSDVKIYQNAIKQINYHNKLNHQVIVISGASEWMVNKVLEATNITVFKEIGTQEKRFLFGMVTGTHCYSENKARILDKLTSNIEVDYIACYSDSSADIPILSLSKNKYLVNPKKRCLIKFKREFGNDFSLLAWD